MAQDWRTDWANDADAERAMYDTKPVSELLAEVQAGRYGEYYTIWYAIADRAQARDAGWVLFDVLRQDIPYLYRYHCAAALLKLLDTTEFTAAQLSSERQGMLENLTRLRQVLAQKLGSAPGA